MRLPLRHIAIAGVKVPVRLDRRMEDYGICERDPVEIVLGAPCVTAPECLLPTLIHEVRHASLIIAGISHGLTHKQEEQVVRCMENIADPAIAELTRKLSSKTPPGGT